MSANQSVILCILGFFFNKNKLKIKYPGSSFFHLVVSALVIVAPVVYKLTCLSLSLSLSLSGAFITLFICMSSYQSASRSVILCTSGFFFNRSKFK